MGPLPPPVRAPTEPVGNHGGLGFCSEREARAFTKTPPVSAPRTAQRCFPTGGACPMYPTGYQLSPMRQVVPYATWVQVQTQGDSSRRRLLTAFGRI